jgi:hypothetical protein
VRVEGNSVVVGSHVAFRVWPEGAVEGGFVDHDEQALTLQLGEQIVSRADPDFDDVNEKVIVAFGWSAVALAVRNGEADEQGFATFQTDNMGRYAGMVFIENDDDITASPDGTYTITDAHARLLIRRQARGARGGPRALAAARSLSSTK